MTTSNHTAIVNGDIRANDAAIWNDPLGQLDAAIGDVSLVTELAGTGVAQKLAAERVARIAGDDTLDTRIDTIIASSGTSSTEVVDGRGSYTVLSQRIDDATFPSSTIWVDANFSGDEASHKRYTTLAAAMLACSGGETVLVAPGIYTEATVAIGAHNVSLIGSGQPTYDSATGRLIGGTIIRGKLRLTSKVGVTIRDLGVDQVGTNADCIESDNLVNVDVWRKFINLTVLGNGSGSGSHGIYGAGNYLTIENVHAIECVHGIAIHGQYVNIKNCIFDRCGTGTSLIIKAKASCGHVAHINASNLLLRGDPAGASAADYAGAIVVQCTESQTVKFVTITNVTAQTCVNGVVQINRYDTTGSIADVHFNNVVSAGNKDAAVVGDFWLKSGDRLTFVNCASIARTGGYGWNADTTTDNLGTVYVLGATDDASGSGPFTGAPTRMEVNGIDLVDRRIQIAEPTNTLGEAITGFALSTGISVTGANTPVCTLAQGNTIDTATQGFSGIVMVHARSSTTTAGSIASYCLWVHRTAHDTSGTVTVIASAGLLTGAAAAYPSFTFTVDATNHHMEATPIASTSGTFYFSFMALGNVRVVAL